MNNERVRRVAAQHAETARLLGVDFVPAFRTGRTSERVIEQRAEPAGPIPASPDSRPVPESTIEVKKVETVPASRAEQMRPEAADAAAAARARVVTRLLDEIRARYEQDAPHQHFVTDHHSIVWGEGDPCAELMFIGEAPGEEEDRTGRPFVGRAGQLLNKMIEAMGLKREQVYITNVLKTRPPNNATPTLEEAELCAPYLFDQIAAIAPRAIVTLGLPATRLILSTQESMGRMRGRWWPFTLPVTALTHPDRTRPREFPVMPTYHPAFILRQYTEENRRKVWSDLQLVMNVLRGGPADASSAGPA